jgi:RNA polymerase sigma-70 factor (ECF subfamily)
MEPLRPLWVINGGMTDDALVIQRSLLEPEAFAQLYDRHAAVIGRFANRRLGAEAGEDVLAETFLTAFSRRARYDLARSDARPWLFGIAVRVIGRHRRDELRLLRAVARSSIELSVDGGFERIDERLSALTHRRVLALALADLPSAQRDVLLLSAWADFSYEEIAAALTIPVGTVRSRLSRAREQLRRALAEAESSPVAQETCDERA